jgi:hypothetical protein
VRRGRKKYEENYYGAEPDSVLRCVVTGCTATVVAEVHTDSYAAALELFRGMHREKIRARRQGDERLFACRQHLEEDARMAELEWQMWMF